LLPSDRASRELKPEKHDLHSAESLLLVCTLLGTLAVLIPWWRLATFPYQIDYGEGLLLEGALSLRQGRPLYPAVSQLPVVLHVYGPLAYAATAATLRSSRVSFTSGRLLILVCALTVSALLASLLRRWTGSLRIALAFALILLTIPAFRFWTYLLRADLIGIALSVSGLALFALKRRYKYWSILFFAAALFCKYSLLAAPLAVFLYLLVTRQFKDAARFATLLALTCGTAFAVFQVSTGGGFAFHMFSTHPDPYSLTQVFALSGLVWLSAPVVAGLALFHVLRKIRSGEPDISAIYFLTASITSLTAGKQGSTTNHFLEWMVAACLCAGMGYATVKSQHPYRLLPVTLALVLSIAIGVLIQSRASQQPYAELAECSGIYDYVASANSPRVLSQSLGPLLLAGKPVLLTDPFVYGQLVQHGKWSDSNLVRLLNERYFDAILTTVDPEHIKAGDATIWPPSLLEAMGRHYHVVKRFQCRDSSLILEPKP
jgi:hypothetical protein